MDAFPPGTLDFLAELREHNRHDWFEANRRRYERDVLAPAKEFATAMAPALDRLAPGIRVLGSIFRINRGTRFSPDKRPYEDHLDFWFWHDERSSAVSGLSCGCPPGASRPGPLSDAGAGRVRRPVRRRSPGATGAAVGSPRPLHLWLVRHVQET